MNVDSYHAKRALLEREEGARGREICWTCRRPVVRCLCSRIAPVATRASFVILIHPMEARKEKLGTGRLAAACLKSARLIQGIDFSEHAGVNALLDDESYFPVLLYPGKTAVTLSGEDSLDKLAIPEGRRLLVFVIDGTWACARKMMQLSRNLQALPRLCFAPGRASEFAIKHQPHDFCLSTIESIHRLLDAMDKTGFDALEGRHENLLEVFRALVDFQVACAADPETSGYRRQWGGQAKAPRKTPVREVKRNLIFE